MKTTLPKILVILAGAATLSSTLPGCAGTATRESTGEYVDDSTITTKVKAAFVHDPTVHAREVQVTTFRGTVQLSGYVDTAAEKAHAETIAAGVSGVRSVQNNISVKGVAE